MMSVPEFVERIMDMRFEPRERSYEAGDCWTVVWLFWRDVLGRQLPMYDTGYHTAGASAVDRSMVGRIMAREREKWFATEHPCLGDVVLLRCSGRACHVGVMISRQRFLHIEDRRGALVESLSSPIWQRRCEGVYRLAE